ncbi:MAG TPA: hypothetical protein VJW20_18210 [Candidatus Angelobacter sp.]|nr:hypothetical protein [Candidatus Angelobacter sp.]
MSGKKQKLRLIHARHNMPKAKQFRCGEKIPESGIYRVVHDKHRLPHEVTLLCGQLFPTCMKCEALVYFELIRGVSDASLDGFKVALYALPAADDEESPAIAS